MYSEEKERRKILVTDDDPANFKVIQENYRELPYDLMYAPNGKAGYEVAIAELPDLILMDWEMPVMNGIEALRLLKLNKYASKIPVLMMTGIMTSAAHLRTALQAGAMDFISKPFDVIELTARVGAALTLSKSIHLIEKKNDEISRLQENKIALKDRELLLGTMHSQESNDFLYGIGARLKLLAGNCSDETTSAGLLKLCNSIQNYLKSENNRETFTRQFEQVHPDFFGNLTSRYPEVTPNEQRLAAYIRIGLNNKEISQLLGVTVGTTKTNVNRLKKKLSLSGEESIRQFLREF